MKLPLPRITYDVETGIFHVVVRKGRSKRTRAWLVKGVVKAINLDRRGRVVGYVQRGSNTLELEHVARMTKVALSRLGLAPVQITGKMPESDRPSQYRKRKGRPRGFTPRLIKASGKSKGKTTS